jgi:hypothetical protein
MRRSGRRKYFNESHGTEPRKREKSERDREGGREKNVKATTQR